MFGIDFEALLLLAVLAFILFGPQKLPEYAAKLGCLMAKLKQATAELNEQCQASFPSTSQPVSGLPDISAENPSKTILAATPEPETTQPTAGQAAAAAAALGKAPVKPATGHPDPYPPPFQSETGELSCPVCYKELNKDFSFCPNCGHQMRSMEYGHQPSEIPEAPAKAGKPS